MRSEARTAASKDLPATPLSAQERDSLHRRKITWLALALVLLSLAFSVLLPRFTHARIARLRNEINSIADPARLRVAEIQLDLALGGSQHRELLLTGQKELTSEFELTRRRRVAAEGDLLSYARQLDGVGSVGLASRARRLAGLDGGLDSLVAVQTDISPVQLREQRARFGAIQRLSDTLAREIDSAAATRRLAIGETETVVALSTATLVALGVSAAFLVARLGAGFRAMAIRCDEQESRFRQIAENLSAVVWLSDPELRRHLYVNSAYERIWGRSRVSLDSDPEAFLEGVHPEDRERVRVALGNIANRVADIEFRIVQPDGVVRWVWCRGFPVRDPDGKPFRIAGIVEDMTAQHAHAEERERLLENERKAREVAEARRSDLERVTESRARLVRGFTHDVKNPLGAAVGFIALLEGGLLGPLADSQRATVAKVRRAIDHALELIADLLDIARAEAGQLELRRQKIDLAKQAREVAEAFGGQANSKQLKIDVMLEPDLPVIETDAARLRQVVGNLISNAVKYTQPGGRIRIRAWHAREAKSDHGHEVIISVADDGPGIPDDKRSILFKEFTRFDPGAAEGAGIGLAISQRIAEALGGQITVKSEPGHGSTFALHLPVLPSSGERPQLQ